MIHEHEVGRFGLRPVPDLFSLAAADEVARLRAAAVSRDGADRDRAGGSSQRVEFSKLVCVWRLAQTDADEDRAFASLRTFEQGILPALRSSGLRHNGCFLFLRPIGGRQADVPRGHDRRNGVLVDHLAH